MKIICNETEKKWLIKALENSEYGCPKIYSLSKCLTKDVDGCLSSTFENCIINQIEFDTK
jgi:hypothetical protein